MEESLGRKGVIVSYFKKLYKNSCNHLIFKINIIRCLLVILLYNQILRRIFFTVSKKLYKNAS